MSKIINQRQKQFHTALGNAVVKTQEVIEFDVEDIIQLRAISQARMIQLINIGKSIDINAPTGARTIASTYFNNEEELPE